jgi:putative ABC transport system permease protein
MKPGDSIRAGVRRLFRLQLRTPDLAREDADRELDSVLAEREVSLVARGMSPEAAHAEAMRRLGGSLGQAREQLHRSAEHRERRLQFAETFGDLLQDLRYAARGLLRRPAYTAVAVLTLAIGIGAATAIFSAVNPILFEPLPYPHSERIVMVWELEKNGSKDNLGFATFDDLARTNNSFESAAAMGSFAETLTGGEEPERLSGQRVSPSFFRVLGVAPALGRDFGPEDDVRGTPRVAILSHALWRARFHGDSSLVGRLITLAGLPFTVIGVMPAGYENVLDPTAQIWMPLRYDVTLPWACRDCHHLRMVARLRPNVTSQQASREMDVLFRGLVRDHPTSYASVGMLVPSLHEEVTGGVRPALVAVLGAATLVLLIACANVTNLLLARGAQREGEFALRAALGAGRARVVRQLLTESTLLAVIGGGLGILVAELGVRAVVRLSPPELPRLGAIAVNGPVLVVSLAVTTLVGLVCGLLPAIHALRANLHQGMQRGSRRSAGTSRLTRGSLVVAEVALALVLLVGSGLLLRSMERLFAVSPGFEPSQLLTLQVQAGGTTLNNDTLVRVFFDRALDAVRRQPGVESAALTSQLPLSGDFDGYGVHSETHPRANPEQDPSAFRYAVTAGYLETMHIPVLRGRGIAEADRADQPPVALISESFAKRVWPGETPIGQRVRVGSAATGPWREIVGIVGDVRQISLAAQQADAIYIPESQWPFADDAMSLVVRTRGDAPALAPAIRRAIWSVNKDQPILRIATGERLVAESAAQRRFALVLFEAFGSVALVLAAAGIYGVLAGTVTERLREMGIRAALGASRRNLVSMVLRQGLAVTGIGVLIGSAVALPSSRLIGTLLFGVSQADAPTYVAVMGVLVAVALLACWIPARRASRVDPVVALRAE